MLVPSLKTLNAHPTNWVRERARERMLLLLLCKLIWMSLIQNTRLHDSSCRIYLPVDKSRSCFPTLSKAPNGIGARSAFHDVDFLRTTLSHIPRVMPPELSFSATCVATSVNEAE